MKYDSKGTKTSKKIWVYINIAYIVGSGEDASSANSGSPLSLVRYLKWLEAK